MKNERLVSTYTLQGGVYHTTNNRMELTAVVMALENLKGYDLPVHIFTDAKYVKDGITDWIHKWKTNGWRNSKRKPILNKDLWVKLDSLSSEFKIEWHWEKGHSTNAKNNLVDTIARRQSADAKRGLEKESKKRKHDTIEKK
jgi:ribonuclease HI